METNEKHVVTGTGDVLKVMMESDVLAGMNVEYDFQYIQTSKMILKKKSIFDLLECVNGYFHGSAMAFAYSSCRMAAAAPADTKLIRHM